MEINLFGEVNFRGSTKKFGIKTDDRRRHMYCIGKTGMGKTTLLENMVLHDIMAGHGVGIIDPHGDFAEKMLEFVPKERIKDVIYFNPADIEHPVAFNPIEKVSAGYRHLVASGLMGVFKKIWPDVWSARMEYILNNSLLSLLESPDATLLDVMRLMSDKDYRKGIVDNLQDPVMKNFWVNEFAKYAQKFETEATAAIQNKIGKFVANPLVRHILGQPTSALDFRKNMDEKKIMIFNLSKGRIGEDNSALLGSMIITKLQLAAMSRVDIPEPDRKDFFLYVDEFQNFATDSFANILSEARKYRLALILAHQYIGQLVHDMNTKVRDAVFGNVGTMVVFRVGAEDAEFLEKEFEPDFMATDIVNLPKANFYLKLMIDGISSRPFSARGIAPVQPPKENHVQEIIEHSRKIYSTPLDVVEKKIAGNWAVTEDMESAERGAAPAPRRTSYGGDAPRRPMNFDTTDRRAPSNYPPRPMNDVRSAPYRPPMRDSRPPVNDRPVYKPAPRVVEEHRPAPAPAPKPFVPPPPMPEKPKPPAPTMSLKDLPPRPAAPGESHGEISRENSYEKKPVADLPALRQALKDSLDKKKNPQ